MASWFLICCCVGVEKHTNVLSSGLDIETAFRGHTALHCTYRSYAVFLPEGIDMWSKVGLEILFTDYTLENKFCNFNYASPTCTINMLCILPFAPSETLLSVMLCTEDNNKVNQKFCDLAAIIA